MKKYLVVATLLLSTVIPLLAEEPITLFITKAQYQESGTPILLEVGQHLVILEPLPDNPQLASPTFSADVLYLNRCGRTVGPERNWLAFFTAITPGETTVHFGNDQYVVDVISIDSDDDIN